MIEQTARVVSTQHNHAWVLPLNSMACNSCSTKASAGCSNAFSFLSSAKAKCEPIYVQNPLHAKPGEEVVIGTQGNTLVMYSVLAYLLPLISMLVFAILGSQVFQALQLPQEGGAVLAGIAGLFSGFKLANWLATRMNQASDTMHPVILRHKEHYIYPASISHV
ncbi:MAG TPA: SoxR reducing system RseC family protein [Thiolinea sp.]|nr:SoxR reducing system RseC family protein [Thiolinea sp.]